ncbi:hypothetical protein DTW90_02585 [Neorhizobium sp. P12A]|nr:hypothetical protein DTW90_02585 [Neorhizobium sp. P12A]
MMFFGCHARLLTALFVILGLVPRICNRLIVLTCLDPRHKAEDDVERLDLRRHTAPSKREKISASSCFRRDFLTSGNGCGSARPAWQNPGANR